MGGLLGKLYSVENTCVRFDDLSQGGSGSFSLAAPEETFVARRLEDVVPVVRAAEAAATAGYWVAGFVTYEAAPAFNPVLNVRPSGLHDPMRDLPLARFQAFSRRVEEAEADRLEPPAGAYNVSAWSPDSSRRDYRDSLAMTGRALMSGEISRGKHTFRLHAAFNGDHGAFYRDLLQSQRGAYASCIEAGRFRLVSASPERFFRRNGDILTLRPVLASARRGRWLDEDRRLAAVLSGDAESSYSSRVILKEIESELGELGDLIPTAPTERFSVERMETLWSLTAELAVTLDPDVDLIRIFETLFPAVSVTGVPKSQAMDLISLTEDTPRGAYCGAIGFIAPPGSEGPDASFSVAVRTVVIDLEEGVAEYGVGTAITNTSDVISAYEEARLKARILVERRPEFSLLAEMRVEDGLVRNRDGIVQRLLDSAEYFGFAADNEAVATGIASAAADAMSDSLLRLYVGRDGEVRAEAGPLPPWSSSFDGATTVIAAIASQAVSTENVFLFHRTTDVRLRDTAARQHPNAEDVVLINQLDEVAGTLNGSVVAKVGGVWVTPPCECGNSGGAYRNQLVADGVIHERVLTRSQLVRADDIAAVDDAHGWRRIQLLA